MCPKCRSRYCILSLVRPNPGQCMKKTHERLMALLYDGREFSLEQLREELGLKSNKQAKRVITRLRAEGCPIEETFQDRKKYFHIHDHRQRHKKTYTLDFSEEEVQTLGIAAQAARSALEPTPLLASLNSAFTTLLSALAEHPVSVDTIEQQQRWHFGSAPSVRLDPEVFNLLRSARLDKQSVRFDYVTASTGKVSKNRKVDPYNITMRGTTWLLIAYCHTRKSIRDFAIVDISNVRVCDPDKEHAFFEFRKDFDLDLLFRDRFNALAGGEIYEVRLLVEPDRARYFRRKLYHPTQQIEKEENDGRLIVSYEVAGLDEIRSFVQSWGAGVTVLEPAELVEMVKGELETLMQRYAEIL